MEPCAKKQASGGRVNAPYGFVGSSHKCSGGRAGECNTKVRDDDAISTSGCRISCWQLRISSWAPAEWGSIGGGSSFKPPACAGGATRDHRLAPSPTTRAVCVLSRGGIGSGTPDLGNHCQLQPLRPAQDREP